ncbi:alpha/beta hydrolase [Galactobacter caseinivorans]
MDGFRAARGGDAPERVNVLAHSYGSTTAAEGLWATRYRVNSFVNYGSVGFTLDQPVTAINADQIFRTKGELDLVANAGLGAGGQSRKDPQDLGAIDFSATDEGGLRGVDGHSAHLEGGVGYLTPGSTSLSHIIEIIKRGRP